MPAIQAAGQTSGTKAGRTSAASKGPKAVTSRDNSRDHSSPAAKEKIEVIGQQNGSLSGTMDKPLLPIASLGNNLGIRSGTPIQVRFSKTVDSGHARNGDTVQGTLAQPLVNLPAGTPVKLTVVQASPAGALSSFGELSLQVISIGDSSVLSNTISAEGVEGVKDLPDSAPARGTEAVFTAGQVVALPTA